MKEVEVIYEEFQMDLSWDEWYELYRTATKDKHDFLFIDMYGPDEYKMRKGFDKALVFSLPEDKEENGQIVKRGKGEKSLM